MIKKTVPVFENRYIAYAQGFEGVAWFLDFDCLVEVWLDGSWEFVSPHAYSQYVDWSSHEEG